MKVLFWIIAILSILVGLFMSFVCYMSHGLDLAGTIIGEIVFIPGMLTVVACITCVVFGICQLRKGNAKKAVMLALAGVAYSVIILGGYFLDDAVHTILMERDIAERNAQLYGENWDAPPAIDGIPEGYHEEMNKFYAVIRDAWTADRLTDLYASTMPNYYGAAPLDSIGFCLMDLNGDGIDELLIGTTAPAEEGGTVIFCIGSNPDNLHMNLNGAEQDIYYLHPGQSDGTYAAEISGENAAWLLEREGDENSIGIQYWEGVMDPAGRLTLEMIPFSRYK